MDPLSFAASIIAVLQLSTKVLGYLNDVKDAPKDRAQCAIEISNLYNLLFNLRVRIEEGDPLKPWYTSVRALAIENGPLDQFKQALETLQAKMTDGDRLGKAGQALVWKFKKQEVDGFLGRIERLKSLVGIALELDHLKLSQAIKDDTNITRTQLPVLQSGVDKIRQVQDDAKHHRLMEWISPADYPAQQSDIIKRKQEGTGQWFLDAPEVARWQGEAKGTLFCPGIPGAGKTMVAAIAIDHLLKSMHNSLYGVAYVYCNYKEEQDTSSMLAAILKQLAQGRPSTAAPVERLHEQHAARGTAPSLDDIFSALRDVLTNYTAVYVVIDALDECQNSNGTRSQFLTKLKDLQAVRDIRLMATSRFIPEIEDAFREDPRLEVKASKEDVERFVAGQMYRLPRCIQRDSTLQNMVKEQIVEAVDGMFLLARLHTDSLQDKRTPKDVKSALAKLSKGSTALDHAYKDALQRIQGQLQGDQELAQKVLSWITLAKRPLTTAEICCALAIEPGEPELDTENMPDVEDLVSVCAGLVVIDEESAIIRLVHYTTQEFFERTRGEWNPNGPLYIARTCLAYLCFDTFKSGGCSTSGEFAERLRQNQFLDYAAKHWGEHARMVEAEIFNAVSLLLFQTGSLACASQVLFISEIKYGKYSRHYPAITILHIAARFGLSDTTVAIFCGAETPCTIPLDEKDSWGRAPLWLAAANGHVEMAKLLLDMGADVNAEGGRYGNALYVASEGGHEAVAKLLLENSANVNAEGGLYGNALQAASAGGHRAIAKLLLDKGANINAEGGYYGNALYAASAEGYKEIAKLLLDNGANVNAEGRFYSNALQAASARGHELIAKLLLNKGADLNVEGGEYGNALYAASAGGHEAIAKLLLNNGANVNAEGGHYGNALYIASKGGHEAVAKLLLENGANVNAESIIHGKALYVASAEGHESIAKLLLDNGANANAEGGHNGNALQAASKGGHASIAKLLLDKGANINAEGGLYGNALYAASAEGYEAIAKLLLDKGADVNAKSGRYGNALYAASEGGHKAVVKLLLDNGANVNAEGGYFGNALHAASARGHKAIVKLLLDKGANVNAESRYYGNTLQAASAGGHESIAKLLLDKGADVNAESVKYSNALQAASEGGHESIAKLLLDNGANINAEGGRYDNALQAASARGHELIAKLLLDNGANANAKGGEYGNALQAAYREKESAIVELLIEKGADLNVINNDGWTPLNTAADRGYFRVVELLIEKGADLTVANNDG